jgi:hypothetical protein
MIRNARNGSEHYKPCVDIAYSGDVNNDSDDVNKVGAKRRWQLASSQTLFTWVKVATGLV